MKKYLSFILLCLLLVSCAPDESTVANLAVDKYITTLDKQDLEGQMEVLEAFEMDSAQYEASFLRYVEGATLLSKEVRHEDDYFLIVEANFELVLSDDFPASDRLRPGKNTLTRFFTFYKNEKMALKEILPQLLK